MTILYDQRQFETLSFNDSHKSEEERYEITEEVNPKVNRCKHCTRVIVDKYYYRVDGVSWHSCCLRCYGCQVSLANMRSCFSKNQKIWCKQDYNRQFRCQKCLELLRPTDLVMRSGSNGLPFHVGCFRCYICDVLLLSGDSYGSLDNRLFCKKDFLTAQGTDTTTLDPSEITVERKYIDISVPISDSSRNYRSVSRQLSPDETRKERVSDLKRSKSCDDWKVAEILDDNNSEKQYTTLETCVMNYVNRHDEEDIVEDANQDKAIHNIQLKIEKVTSPTSNNEQDEKQVDDTVCSADVSSETDVGKETVDRNSTMEASTVGTDDEDASGASCSDDSDGRLTVSGGKHAVVKKGVTSLRQKRVRTSFKHQQLRTMKAYFTMNHNPDSKDLRQLSQKTGLSKRVLQVWFQNARAKFRRSLCRQASIMCPPSSNSMQLNNVFDDSLLSIDKNGNYTNKQAKMTSFADIISSSSSSSAILNHSSGNSQRLCNISDIGYSNMIRDRYHANDKHYIPTSGYYNIGSQNSPSLFSMDVGNLAANLGLVDFSRDNIESFHLAELGIGQKL